MLDLFWINQLEINLFILDSFFFLFSFLIIINSLLVIFSTNPIYSIFYLILVFLNGAILLLLSFIDFLSIIILVVYVGAIAVLFLFVVMMMNIKVILLQESLYRYLPLGFLICFCFLLEIFFILNFEFFKSIDLAVVNINYITITNWFLLLNHQMLISSLAECIFAYKWIYFILSAVILFLAMVGAIVLTHTVKKRNLIKSQLISDQVFVLYKDRLNLFYIKDFN